MCDDDSRFRYRFKIVLEAADIELIKPPFQARNPEAYPERSARWIKGECLSRIIPFGECDMHRIINGALLRENHERNRQGMDNELIDGEEPASIGRIECTERVGGLLKYYHRAVCPMDASSGPRLGGGDVPTLRSCANLG